MTKVAKNRRLDSGVDVDVKAAMAIAALVTFAALLIDDGSVGLLLGLLVFGLVLYAAARAPMRYTMMTLLFFVLVLPNPAEGKPTDWEPPLWMVGGVLLNHLNTLDRSGILGSIPVSAMEILFFCLLLIRLFRTQSGSTIDGNLVPTPKPLIKLSYLALATAVFTWLHGLASGGDYAMSLWQLNAVIYVPIIFLLFQAGLRGSEDLAPIAKVVIVSAVYRAVLAVYVVMTQEVPMDPNTGSTRPAFATSHHDSMLFAAAFLIVFGVIIEPFKTRTRWLISLVVPVIAAGIWANNRRLAWVQVAATLVMVYLLSRETKLKRLITRGIKLSIPLVVLYLVVGWNRGSSIFKPIRIFRSVIEAETDASSLWRELENLNIIVTFRHNPIFGSGFGHPYEEVVAMPPVPYSLERYIPHNSLLGQWAYMGFVGFTGLTLLWIAGVYCAVLAYRNGKTPVDRVGALVSFGAVPIYLLQSWGDLGLASWVGLYIVATAIAVGGKLVVSTGSWVEGPRPRTATAPAAAVPPDFGAAADGRSAAPPMG